MGLMNRRTAMAFCILFAACLAPLLSTGCRREEPGIDDAFPVELQGGWKRAAVVRITDVPPEISQTGNPTAVAVTTYTGQGAVRVRAYRMKNETLAFELQQKYHNADELAAARGPLFYVAMLTNTDRGTAMAVLSELRRAGQ
jgi:hypothetical protein